LNRLGNHSLTWLFRLFTGIEVTDVCTGLYAFNERVLRNLSLQAEGFDVEADIFTSAFLMDARFAEVPVDYGRRVGKPKLIPMRSGLRIGRRMFIRRVQGLDGRAPLPEVPALPAHPSIVWDERVRDRSVPRAVRVARPWFLSLLGRSEFSDLEQDWSRRT
jgi:hypothetical protein